VGSCVPPSERTRTLASAKEFIHEVVLWGEFVCCCRFRIFEPIMKNAKQLLNGAQSWLLRPCSKLHLTCRKLLASASSLLGADTRTMVSRGLKNSLHTLVHRANWLLCTGIQARTRGPLRLRRRATRRAAS